MGGKILITGGSGRIGTTVRPLLAEAGYSVRILDVAEPPALGADDEFIAGSVIDRETVRKACEGVDLVVHLAGHRSERPWEEILQTNIHGAQVILEAAHQAGVRRVFLASSLHAAGYTKAGEAAALPVLHPRPDSFYGVSKVALEALGSVYADRCDMSIVSGRIGSFMDKPTPGRVMNLWVSPGDLTRLILATAELTEPGHHVIWAISNNTRGCVSLEAGKAIGFVPVDDSENFVAELGGNPESLTSDELIAGAFVRSDRPLGFAAS